MIYLFSRIKATTHVIHIGELFVLFWYFAHSKMRSHSPDSKTLQLGKLKVNRYAMGENSTLNSLFIETRMESSLLSYKCLVIRLLGRFYCALQAGKISEKPFISNSWGKC